MASDDKAALAHQGPFHVGTWLLRWAGESFLPDANGVWPQVGWRRGVLDALKGLGAWGPGALGPCSPAQGLACPPPRGVGGAPSQGIPLWLRGGQQREHRLPPLWWGEALGQPGTRAWAHGPSRGHAHRFTDGLGDLIEVAPLPAGAARRIDGRDRRPACLWRRRARRDPAQPRTQENGPQTKPGCCRSLRLLPGWSGLSSGPWSPPRRGDGAAEQEQTHLQVTPPGSSLSALYAGVWHGTPAPHGLSWPELAGEENGDWTPCHPRPSQVPPCS